MGKIEEKDFDIEFIERTQTLIKEYNGQTEFTLLLNCLLGLIILPNQFNQRKRLKYLDSELTEIPDIFNSLKINKNFKFNPTKRERGSNPPRYVPAKQNLKSLLKSIKNALSHIETIKPINKNEKWVGVKLIDKNMTTQNIEMECVLKYSQIKIIAEHISTEYQREILKL